MSEDKRLPKNKDLSKKRKQEKCESYLLEKV